MILTARDPERTATAQPDSEAPAWLLNTPHLNYSLAACDPCRSTQPDQEIELTFAEYEALKSFLHIYRGCPNIRASTGLPSEAHAAAIQAQTADLKEANTDEQQEAFHLDSARRYIRMCPDLVLSVNMPEPWASILEEFEESRQKD